MRHLEERETLSLEWDKQDKVYCGEFPWLEGTPWFLKINKPISICGCSRFSLCLNCVGWGLWEGSISSSGVPAFSQPLSPGRGPEGLW